MNDTLEMRKKFFDYYKYYVESIEKHDLDYSFYSGLSIYERDYKIYSPDAYFYAMTMIKEGVSNAGN